MSEEPRARSSRSILQQPLTVLSGIGERRAQQLQDAFGVSTVQELLSCLPRRYEPPRPFRKLAEAQDQESIRVRVVVDKASVWRSRGRSFLQVRVHDDTGKATAVYFNQPYLKDHFQAGREICLEARAAHKRGLRLYAPRVLKEADLEHDGLTPLYPEREACSKGILPRAIQTALVLVREQKDWLPASLRGLVGVPDIVTAWQALHQPKSVAGLEPARRRLAWEEILNMERRRLRRTARIGPRIASRQEQQIWERIAARLPFTLTAEQSSVLEALRSDLRSGEPMRRLLHGEVGSGKTVLAFALALAVTAQKKQTALLAPTEVLARQHLNTFRKWLIGSRVRVEGLFGDDNATRRRAALTAIASGTADIVIGTHALYQKAVRFAKLKLVIFDEQHRFGVRQKAALVDKGIAPHVLTMTATPIPRTLAWSRYGALNPCILRERPGTSAPIATEVLPMEEWPGLSRRMKKGLQQGKRAFVVVPHIRGPEGLEAYVRSLRQGVWKSLNLEVVHGRLAGCEVETAVRSFAEGRTSVLMGTTVVEVGLDVPAIPWMVVLHAQHLGLASLHQLRGRLARGPEAPPGKCWVLAEETALDRLRVLESCADGFAVAEMDFLARGPGALRGTRQHGRGDFRVFLPGEDADLLEALNHPRVSAWLKGEEESAATV